MSNNEWEYCQIRFQIIDDGREATRGSGLGTRLMWIQFVAEANEFGKIYIAGKSERLPMPNNSRAGLTPQKGNSGQQNILNELVQTLKHDGWELLPSNNGEWWGRNFRRPTSLENVKKSKVNRKERLMILGALVALAIIGTLVFSLFPQAERERELREFTSADLVKSDLQSNPTVGRMVVIDLDTNQLDSIQQSLPANMVTENFDEVETVVWVDCDRESNWKGANVDCLVTVIDWDQKAISAQQTFDGEFTLHPTDPETNEKTELSNEALRNSASIRNYLANLPKSKT
ncbi:MAG: hypothetical protein AB8G95_14510 [Anaerolineae bacterium]